MAKAPNDMRLPFSCSRDMFMAIENYRYDNRLPTRAEAMRQLLEKGLKAVNESLVEDGNMESTNYLARRD